MNMEIFILESLKIGDQKTGQQIHDFLDSKGLSNKFFEFKTKQELLDLLLYIKNISEMEKVQPFVHFDCHGDENGIGIVKANNSLELITWREISASFREIYIASEKKSVICMSTCKGFNAIKLVAYFEPCPYDYVCGSFQNISFNKSFLGYSKFYELLFNGKSIQISAMEIHKDPNLSELNFIAMDAHTLFKKAIDGYLEIECTQKKLAEMKDITKNNLKQFGPLIKKQIDYLNEAYTLDFQKQIIKRYSDTFFALK